MNRRSAIRVAALAVLAAFAAPIRAQDPSAMMGNNCMMVQLTQLCPAKMGTPEFSACAKERSGDAMAACQQQTQAAGAAAAKQQASAANPCADDIPKYCPGLWPGTPEFGACMKKHNSDLTPACAAFAKKRAAQGSKPGSDICVADSKKYCPGLTIMDHDKYMSCMMKNYDSLSPTCQAKFKGLKGASTGPHADCMAGLQKLCPDLQPGDQGAMMQCMMAHRQELPPSCHDHGAAQ